MTNWTCDYGPLGNCRNPHGCHCREIANLSEAPTKHRLNPGMTTDSSKATARPWVAIHRGSYYRIGPQDEVEDPDAQGIHVHGPQKAERAALIVRAVNRDHAFDAMKEALEPALVALEIQPRTITDNGEPYLTPLWTPEQSEVRAAAKRKIRAALRVANGEGQ